MIRFLIYTTAVALTVAATIDSSYADGPQTKAPSSQGISMAILKGPKAIAGLCTGFVIGIPICFARKLPQETKEGAHGIVGSIVKDGNNKFLLVPATLIYLPAACVFLTLEAPSYALRDAYMADKPFSKEQFSLGELDPGKGNN